MNAFFIGAGASYGTLCNHRAYPPIATDFGRVLAERVVEWATEFPALRDVIEHLGPPITKYGLEPIWTCVDYYAKLRDALPQQNLWSNESPELKRALLRLYGSPCDEAADELPLSTEYTLGYVVAEKMQPGDLVISFNYDTVVERLAKRFGKRLRMACSGFGRNDVFLTKPHGSTSWPMDRSNCTVQSAMPDGTPRLTSLAESEVAPGLEPLLLGAVPIKSELIREVQIVWGMPSVFETVMGQWRSVVNATRDADSITVLGYGFPREDHYGRFLLGEAVKERTSAPVVEFYELPARADATAASILEVFKQADTQVVWQGMVVPP